MFYCPGIFEVGQLQSEPPVYRIVNFTKFFLDDERQFIVFSTLCLLLILVQLMDRCMVFEIALRH